MPPSQSSIDQLLRFWRNIEFLSPFSIDELIEFAEIVQPVVLPQQKERKVHEKVVRLVGVTIHVHSAVRAALNRGIQSGSTPMTSSLESLSQSRFKISSRISLMVSVQNLWLSCAS